MVRNDWRWGDRPFTPTPQVVEKEQKLVLYDKNGRPLTKDRTVGFKPPKKEGR